MIEGVSMWWSKSLVFIKSLHEQSGKPNLFCRVNSALLDRGQTWIVWKGSRAGLRLADAVECCNTHILPVDPKRKLQRRWPHVFFTGLLRDSSPVSAMLKSQSAVIWCCVFRHYQLHLTVPWVENISWGYLKQQKSTKGYKQSCGHVVNLQSRTGFWPVCPFRWSF